MLVQKNQQENLFTIHAGESCVDSGGTGILIQKVSIGLSNMYLNFFIIATKFQANVKEERII